MTSLKLDMIFHYKTNNIFFRIVTNPVSRVSNTAHNQNQDKMNSIYLIKEKINGNDKLRTKMHLDICLNKECRIKYKLYY